MRNLLALLLALALTLPTTAVFADGGGGSGSSGSGSSGSDSGSGTSDSGSGTSDSGSGGDDRRTATSAPLGNASAPAANGSADDRRERGGDSERSGEGRRDEQAMRNLTAARKEGREDFQDQVDEAKDACHALRGRDRDSCQGNLTAQRRAFEEEQRAAFEEALAELRNRSLPDERLGGFHLANGTWTGRFVSFQWDAANLSVLDYTVGGVQVFDRVTLPGLAGTNVTFDDHGRTAQLRLGDARLLLHDNPGGVLVARAGNGGNLSFLLNSALNASLAGEGLDIAGPGNFSAALHGHDLALANGTATASREATFVAHEGNVALPLVANAHRDAIEDAKDEAHVGAEVTVAGEGSDDVDTQVLDAPLNLNVTHTEDGLRVVVNATGLGPRTIVLNVAAGLLKGDRVNVSYFDEANGTFHSVPIVEASSLADVLDPTDDSTPEYWVVHDRDGVQVLVSVPHFSTHAFEVQGFLQEVPPSVVGGIVAAFVFVAVAGVALFGRKPR